MYISERVEVAVQIQGRPVVTDPIADGDADVGDQPPPSPNAAAPGPGFCTDFKVPQQLTENLVQRREVRGHGQPKAVQGEDRVNAELAGQMKETSAAAVDPADRPAAEVEFLRLEENVKPAAFPANADQRRVLAQDKGAPSAVASNLISDPPLEAQHRIKVHLTKQEDFQRVGTAVGGSGRVEHLFPRGARVIQLL